MENQIHQVRFLLPKSHPLELLNTTFEYRLCIYIYFHPFVTYRYQLLIFICQELLICTNPSPVYCCNTWWPLFHEVCLHHSLNVGGPCIFCHSLIVYYTVLILYGGEELPIGLYNRAVCAQFTTLELQGGPMVYYMVSSFLIFHPSNGCQVIYWQNVTIIWALKKWKSS